MCQYKYSTGTVRVQYKYSTKYYCMSASGVPASTSTVEVQYKYSTKYHCGRWCASTKYSTEYYCMSLLYLFVLVMVLGYCIRSTSTVRYQYKYDISAYNFSKLVE